MKFRAFINLLLIAGFLLVAASAGARDGLKEAGMKQNMKQESFLDLFQKKFDTRDPKETAVKKRQKAAAQYIATCCETREAVIDLLKQNGFKVRIHSKMDPKLLKSSIRGIGGVVHDEVISGTRSPGLLRFWQITTTYRADIYFEGDNVVYVSAVVDTVMP